MRNLVGLLVAFAAVPFVGLATLLADIGEFLADCAAAILEDDLT